VNAQEPKKIKMLRVKEPEPEDGDILSEVANASKKRPLR